MEGTEAQVQVQKNSEVARLLLQIREEFESARLGLSGLAEGTARHQVITTKMERMGQSFLDLEALVGDDAMPLIVAQLESVPDQKSSSPQ